MKDYYETLGVNKNATEEELKAAYYKKSKELHPDSETGKEEAFKELTQAYGCLKDKDKRAHYDETGEEPKKRDLVTEKIIDVFMALIEQQPDNFKKWVKMVRRNMLKDWEHHNNAFKQKEDKLEKLKARIKVEPEGGLLSEMIRSQIVAIEKQKVALKEDREATLKALDVIAAYVLEDTDRHSISVSSVGELRELFGNMA